MTPDEEVTEILNEIQDLKGQIKHFELGGSRRTRAISDRERNAILENLNIKLDKYEQKLMDFTRSYKQPFNSDYEKEWTKEDVSLWHPLSEEENEK